MKSILFTILTLLPSIAAQVPANDACGNAISLELGVDMAGSTLSATDDEVDVCANANANSAPGVWYKVSGTGQSLMVTTCSDDTDYDTQLSVYTAQTIDSCEELECVRGNDDDVSCIPRSSVNWYAEVDTEYYVLVHGYTAATGNFRILVENVGPSNDQCTNAQTINVFEEEIGSTKLATQDDVQACGDDNTDSAIGIWYTIEGRGLSLMATTCDDSTDYDTQISIFAGTCEALECVNGNDDDIFCVPRSSVTFNAESGITYYIFVHGFSGDTGNFRLILEETAPYNDFCENAGDIAIGASTQGSTLIAEMDEHAVCGDANTASAPGVWYKVEGMGRSLMASTCDDDTDFDTQISIYTGSCDTLQCVAGADDVITCLPRTSITWFAELKTEYYILVHGFDNGVGNFRLTVTDEGPSNDLCTDAENIDVGGYAKGSTITGSKDNMGPCGSATVSDAPGVWYFVEGTGQPLYLTTCHADTDFDTQVSIYTGSCISLTCLDGNDDHGSGVVEDENGKNCRGLESTVTWQSEAGAGYHVLVHGIGNEVGNFGISVEEVSGSTLKPRPVTPAPETPMATTTAPTAAQTAAQTAAPTAAQTEAQTTAPTATEMPPPTLAPIAPPTLAPTTPPTTPPTTAPTVEIKTTSAPTLPPTTMTETKPTAAPKPDTSNCPCACGTSGVSVRLVGEDMDVCLSVEDSNALISQDLASCSNSCNLPILCPLVVPIPEAECRCGCGANLENVWVRLDKETSDRCVTKERSDILVNEKRIAVCNTDCPEAATERTQTPIPAGCVCSCGSNSEDRTDAVIRRFNSNEDECVAVEEAYFLVEESNVAQYVKNCEIYRGCPCTCGAGLANVWVRLFGENQDRCVTEERAAIVVGEKAIGECSQICR